MNKHFLLKAILFFGLVCFFVQEADAQRRPARRSTRRTTNTQTRTNIQTANATSMPAAADTTPVATIDTLPIKKVKPSLRRDQAIDTFGSTNRTPLEYEYLRADDAAMRHRIWREIDGREKINMPFRYAADESNGNQRFISILLNAIKEDTSITVFNAIDDRFTTPMTVSEIATALAGPPVKVPIYDENGNMTGEKMMPNEISLDSFYRFRLKEEVVWDKRTSRLYWRILGIAPIGKIVTSTGIDLGTTELFWIYYPDLRKTLSNYEVYNAKNLGGRMTWEELFESRMFSGRIIKSSMDNPFDLFIKNYKGYQDQPVLQLMESENIKDKIFTYEQDLWEY